MGSESKYRESQCEICLLWLFLKGRPGRFFLRCRNCTVYFLDMHNYEDRVGIQFRKVEFGQFPQPHVQQDGGKGHQRRNFKGLRIFSSSSGFIGK
jgi:hypothetical protein